ncbi:ABC transporter permease [Nitratireductor sp. StC3]|uniref:ABC transporter permease n=1 Tax=Nitratireductor sp. StC3 TaxID=2126741 RepID=UPI000D0D07B7|nr:ABC transporter permease [Nitratireductor sp. StC3]PSM16801.1 ABC transporter permease [Nitratireductor sp. StC3]
MARWRVCAEPLIAVAVVIVFWEIAVRAFSVSRFVLPAPSELARSIFSNASYLASASLVTLEAILLGFAVGSLLGFAFGVAIGLSRFLDRSLYHVIVFLQTMPKVAIAPLLIVWMGHGLGSKIVLISLVSFVPVLINTIAGIRHLDPRLLYITRSMGGTFLQTLALVRVPASLEQLLSGLKTSLIIAVTVAVVVEFVSANDGLGYVAMIAMGNDDLNLVFAAIVVVAAMGLVLTAAITLIEHRMTKYKRS